MFINVPKRHKLDRGLGLLLLCVIGVSGTIGGSVFVLLSGGIELAGAYTPLAFVIGGMLALLGGLMYAEVGTTIPRAGADLAFVFTASKKRYHAFIFSWMVLLGDLGYLAINALGFAYYTNLIFGISPVLIALTALLVAAAINIRGAKDTGTSETISIILLLLLLIAFGIYVGINAESIVPTDGFSGVGISGVMAATALVFTSFVGYEYIATLAGEVKEPGKVIPLALVITILFSTFVFASVAYFAVLGVPQDIVAASNAPLLAVADYLGGEGRYIIIPTAILATGGSLIAATMVTSRRLYALVNEGFFGKYLLKLNKNHVPARAIAVCTGLASLLVLSQAVNFVAYMSNSVYLIGLIVIAVSIMALRKKRPYLQRPFKAPLFPVIPWAVILLSLALLMYVNPGSLIAVAIWVGIGWTVYLLSILDSRRWHWVSVGALSFLSMAIFAYILVLVF